MNACLAFVGGWARRLPRMASLPHGNVIGWQRHRMLSARYEGLTDQGIRNVTLSKQQFARFIDFFLPRGSEVFKNSKIDFHTIL